LRAAGATLKLNGYSNALFGKCHKVPVSETSPAGPFDHWPHPSGGFEYFYGLVGGETNQWYPALYENTHGPIRGCHHRTVPADRPRN